MIKPSEVPENWEIKSIGEVSEVIYGDGLPKRERNGGDVPVYGSGGISGYHDESLKDTSAVILGRKGSINEVHYVDEPFWAIDTTYYVDSGERINTKYLYHYFSMYDLERLDASGTIPSLRKGDIIDLDIPVPPLDKQERIVETVVERLERVERLKKSVENVSRLAEEYDESFVLSLMSGGVENQASIPPEDGELPDDWEVVKMKDVGRVETGGTPKTSVDEYWGGDITWIRVSDMPEGIYVSESEDKITEKGLQEGSCSLIDEGDVVLSTRATIGEVAIAKGELATNQGFKSIIPESNLKSKYLAYYLDSITDYLESLGKGATYDEINKTQVQNLTIPLPPVDQQEKIISRIDSFDSERLRLAIDSVDQLFSEYEESVLLYAFKGKIDC